MEPAEYCREIEAHLCRRNEGTLVRISGPAFDLVCGWATSGIPLKVAFQGIDRYLQRIEHKGPRRRPVRIEFCEADVLDAFDAWRRAVGVRAAAAAVLAEGELETGGAEVGDDPAPRRRSSLAAQIERAINRLTGLRTGPSLSSDWDATLDQIVRRLDALRATAKNARGAARDALVIDLAGLDATMMGAAFRTLAPDVAADLAREAELELAPFAGRMAADAYQDARRRCVGALVRDRLALPTLAAE